VIVGAGFDGGRGTVLFDTTGNQTITIAEGGKFCGLTINKPVSGTVTLDGPLSYFGGDFTLTALADGSFSLNNDLVAYRLTITSGTFVPGTYTITFTGEGARWTPGPETYQDIVLNGRNFYLVGTAMAPLM